jgi:hypothetical protein
MERIRLIDLSFQYFIKDILHKAHYNTIDEGSQANLYRIEVPDYLKVMDEYPDPFKEEVYLPTVAVSTDLMTESGLQIGGGYRNHRTFFVYIFCERSGEKDDLSTIIFEGLDFGTKVYNYNTGTPEYVYDVGLGRLVESYTGLAPVAISDLLIDSKSVEAVNRTAPADIGSHRALIRVHTLDLR